MKRCFVYLATTDAGVSLTGRVWAMSFSAAQSQLKKANLHIKSLRQYGAIKTQWLRLKHFFALIFSVSAKQKKAFCNNMAMLLRAGFSIDQAVLMVSQTVTSMRLREVLIEIYQGLSAGFPLSQVFAAHHSVFSPFFINTLTRAGQGESLVGAFESLEDFFASKGGGRRKIIMLIIPPLAIIVMTFIYGAHIYLNWMPDFIAIMKEHRRVLVAPVKQFYYLGLFFHYYALPIFLTLFVGWRLGKLYFKKIDLARYHLQCIFSKVPILSKLQRNQATSDFMQAFSILLGAKFPLQQALEMAVEQVNNLYYKRKLVYLYESVVVGHPFVYLLREINLFSSFEIQVLEIGYLGGDMEKAAAQLLELSTHQRELLIVAKRETLRIIFYLLTIGAISFMVSVYSSIYNTMLSL